MVPQQSQACKQEGDALLAPDEKVVPTRKASFQPYHSNVVPKSENLQGRLQHQKGTGERASTMMLRNIPNKYTQGTLMQEVNDNGFQGKYDFFYLPMDIHNRSNVGYAFINFNTPEMAEEFLTTFAEHRFQRFQSRKIGSVCVAHVQGLDANLLHFENRAVTQARNDQYRPVVLQGERRVPFEEAVTKAVNNTPGAEAILVQPEKPAVPPHSQATKVNLPLEQTQPQPQAQKKKKQKPPAATSTSATAAPTRTALEQSICNLLASISDGRSLDEKENGLDGTGRIRGPVVDMCEMTITELLMARELIDDRLMERGVDLATLKNPSLGMPPGLAAPPQPVPRTNDCGPAYMPFGVNAGVAMPNKLAGECNSKNEPYDPFYDEFGDTDCVTPRNNSSMLGGTLKFSRTRSDTQ